MDALSPRKIVVILAAICLSGGAIFLGISARAPAAQASKPSAPAAPGAAGERAELARPAAIELDYGAMLLKMIVSAALVCLLAWVILRWGLGRLGSRLKSDENMRVLSQLAIGPKRAILVVQVGPKRLILGSTETEITLLCDISEKSFGELIPPEVIEKSAEIEREPAL